MDTLLILLGVLGIGAIIIAIHVFSVDSEAYGQRPGREDAAPGRSRERRAGDRRSGRPIVFPLVINDRVVQRDRRLLADRRGATG